MFNISLLIFLFISPILFLPLSVPGLATLQWHQFGFFTNNIEVVQRQIFMYGIVLLVIISLFDNPKRLFGDNYLKFFLFSCFCSVFAHPISIKIFPTIFLGFLLYYLVSVLVDVKNLKLFFWVIFLVSFLNTAFSILQLFNIHFLIFKNDEIIGLMAYKTQLGIYQSLALPICYSLNPWLSVIPIVGLLLSNSATSLVAVAIGMIYFLWKKGVRINVPYFWLGLLTISGIYIYKHIHKLGIRFDSWVYAINGGIEHIFRGNGSGLFQYTHTYFINGKPWPVNYTDPYSIYFECFWSVGIFGLIAVLFFMGEKLLNFKSDNNLEIALFTSCLILFLVGFGYSFMDYPRLAGTAIILFGLLTAVKEERKNLCL